MEEGEVYTVKSTHYRYLASPTNPNVDILHISVNNNQNKVLIGQSHENEKQFWLASSCVMTRAYAATWGLFNYAENHGGAQVNRFSTIFASWKDCPNWTGFNGTHTKYVRAVVYINEAVELVEQDDGSWSLQ